MSKVTELWAWICDEDGGIVGCYLPGLGATALVSANRKIANDLSVWAKKVADESGKRVTLTRFERAEAISSFKGKGRGENLS